LWYDTFQVKVWSYFDCGGRSAAFFLSTVITISVIPAAGTAVFADPEWRNLSFISGLGLGHLESTLAKVPQD
jgi:hypothetical protein